MPDIFSLPLDEAAVRARNGREADVTPEPPAPRYVPMDSFAAAAEVFRDITATKMPDEDVIAALPRDSDGNYEYRTRLQVHEIPSDRVVGVLSRSHFASQIQAVIDSGNTSTYISTLQKSQEPNGRWMIVDRGIQKGRMRRLDGLRATRPMEEHDGVPVTYAADSSSKIAKEPAEVSIDTLECRILWMDMLGRPNVKRDVKGEIISEMDVTVKNTTDPALLAALAGQGEALTKVAEAMSRPQAPVSLSSAEASLAERERKLAEREKALDAMTAPPKSAK